MGIDAGEGQLAVRVRSTGCYQRIRQQRAAFIANVGIIIQSEHEARSERDGQQLPNTIVLCDNLQIFLFFGQRCFHRQVIIARFHSDFHQGGMIVGEIGFISFT